MPASAGPTSQAAANSSAVLARITARYSSSVVAVFLAAASCITSPSAITAAAEERISSARSDADLDHHLEGLAEQEIADQHARLVAPEHAGGELAAAHVAFVDHVVVQQRRGVHELDRGGELDVAVAGIAGELAPSPASASAAAACRPRRSGGWRPPGSSSTSEPVRDRIVALTRSMSAATSSTSRSIEAAARAFKRDDDGQDRLSGSAKDARA